jgi:hypothetical protein
VKNGRIGEDFNHCFCLKMNFCVIYRLAYRQRMVEYRARFDANKNVKDLMKAKRLLISGEDELKKGMYWHTDNFNCTYI